MSNGSDELLKYWERINNLPLELRDIFMENWDYTGRPITEFPKKNAIMAILKKNGGDPKTFLADMLLVFPDTRAEDNVLYYHAFLVGADYTFNKFNQLIVDKKK